MSHMQNVIAFLITADFMLLIALFCVKSFLLPALKLDRESLGDRL